MPTGVYSNTLRNRTYHYDQRVVLEFWANNRQNEDDWIVLDNLRHPGQLTACHNVADTFIQHAGTGPTTTVISNVHGAADPAMANAIATIAAGDVVMEIKFADDHSVLLISTNADPLVEILEGWAGAGAALGSNPPYAFTNSVFDDHDAGRITKAAATTALTNAVNGVNLATNVGALTRCVAGACGIGKNPFRVTVKYRQLGPLGPWQLNTQNQLDAATTHLARLVYDEHPRTLALHCTRCFAAKPGSMWKTWTPWWHDCATCHVAYCGACGALQPRATGPGMLGGITRARRCPTGHTMTMF